MLNALAMLIDDAIAAIAAYNAIDDFRTMRPHYAIDELRRLMLESSEPIDLAQTAIDDFIHSFAPELFESAHDALYDATHTIFTNRYMRSYDSTLIICFDAD